MASDILVPIPSTFKNSFYPIQNPVEESDNDNDSEYSIDGTNLDDARSTISTSTQTKMYVPDIFPNGVDFNLSNIKTTILRKVYFIFY